MVSFTSFIQTDGWTGIIVIVIVIITVTCEPGTRQGKDKATVSIKEERTGAEKERGRQRNKEQHSATPHSTRGHGGGAGGSCRPWVWM